MRSLLLSLGILLTVISVSVFGAFFTDRKLERFYDVIEDAIPAQSDDADVIEASAQRIEEEYEHLRRYLILFIHDDGVREIEEHISDIKSSALSNEIGDAMTAKSRLTLHIKQLRRLSKFSTEAIF